MQNTIRYNEISNCGTGVELFNSTSLIVANHIHDNVFGVKLFNNSYTLFNNESYPHQIIQDNDSYELYASANSFPTIFRYNQIIDEDNLGNSNNDPMFYWDINVLYEFSPIDIRYNYWGEIFDPYEDLYPTHALLWSPVWEPGKSFVHTPDEDEILYQTALSYFAEEDYTNAETAFKELIITYPQSRFAIAALHELFALQQFIYQDYASLQDYYAAITPEDSILFDVADFLRTRCQVKEKNWQPAVDWYEYRIENPPSYQDSVFFFIYLGDIHLMMEADTLGGAKSHPTAHYTLAHIKPKSKAVYEQNKAELLATLPQIQKSKIINLKSKIAQKGALAQNIPNPANGATTISYELYTEGTVELRIYNVMGQLLKTLPQGVRKEGKYQTTVSLAGVPSGMYQYVLFLNGERADAMKMMVQ
jgi:tetratricopeptide (TPR) repeat protein